MSHHHIEIGSGPAYILISIITLVLSKASGVFNYLSGIFSAFIPNVNIQYLPEPSEIISASILAVVSAIACFITQKICASLYKKIFKPKKI